MTPDALVTDLQKVGEQSDVYRTARSIRRPSRGSLSSGRDPCGPMSEYPDCLLKAEACLTTNLHANGIVNPVGLGRVLGVPVVRQRV